MSKSTKSQPRQRRPLGVEVAFFLGLTLFFGPVTLLYGFWSGWEPVGSTALALVMAMWAMIGFFLALQSRKVDVRPEDDPSARIEDHPTSDYGEFSPWSWWPLVLGLACALVFLGVGVGWWVTGIGVALGLIGLIGHVFEYNRGPHTH